MEWRQELNLAYWHTFHILYARHLCNKKTLIKLNKPQFELGFFTDIGPENKKLQIVSNNADLHTQPNRRF